MMDMLDEWHRLSYLIQTHKQNQPIIAYPLVIHAPNVGKWGQDCLDDYEAEYLVCGTSNTVDLGPRT